MNLTPKQRRFVEEYVIDSNATAAAKRAGYSERTAAEQGYQLLQKPSVHAAVEAAQAELRERTKVSVETVTKQLHEAYDEAASNGQAGAMVQASMGIAKLHGLPDGHLVGREYTARNPTRADRRPGSFSVNVATGKWADFATADAGGDVVSLAAYLSGTGQAEAARALADMLGVRHD